MAGETLDPPVAPVALDADVDHQLIELRREREAKLERLRRLQLGNSAGSDPAVLIDIAEARVELQILHEEWRGLLARALSDNDWRPIGSEHPVFADIHNGNGWSQARARVPLTPDSLLFVHGPVTLWHAATLAETQLEVEERIDCLVKCAFHRELAFEPQIAVWDQGLVASPKGFAREDIAVSGEFRTSLGRTLCFAAVPDPNHIPTARAGWHPVTRALIERGKERDRNSEPDTIREQLDPTLWPDATTAQRGSDILLAKGEALLGAVTQNMVVGDRIMLLARVADIDLSQDFASWLRRHPELHYEFDWARRKPIPGRGSFVPFRYRFQPGSGAWQRSMFICLDSHIGM